MAVVNWYDGNQGGWRYKDITRYYDITGDTYSGKNSDGTLTLDWNFSRSFSPSEAPWKIEIDYVGAVKGTNGGFTDGTIKKIRYYDTDGNKIMDIKKIDIPLFALQHNYDNGNNDLFHYAVAGGSTFNGSDDASGPDQDWDGDSIHTGLGDDIVYGNGGDDFIVDYGGADKYYGGNKEADDGWEELDYSEFIWRTESWVGGREVPGIVVRMDKGKIEGPDGHTDKIFGIEAVRGTFLDDKFVGNGENNFFRGMGGTDEYDGKGGYDEIRFDRDNRQGGEDGVEVNLKKGKAVDGFGNTENLKNIEGARGTDYDDKFIADNKGNYFSGRDGNDKFEFGKNKAGHGDAADGGGGADTFVMKGDKFREVEIYDFELGVDTLKIKNVESESDVSFVDDGEGNTVVMYGDNSVFLYGVGIGSFGYDDLG